jgi:hypothetical protein
MPKNSRALSFTIGQMAKIDAPTKPRFPTGDKSALHLARCANLRQDRSER